MKVPRHTTVIAYAALFVSLGGTGYAATQLAPNSVGTKEVRNGSIQTRDLARGVLSRKNAKLSEAITQVVSDPATGLNISVTAQDGKDGLPGPAGPQGEKGADSAVPGPKGDTGATGPRGSALGYAHVLANGTVDAARTTSNAVITKPSGFSGTYCVDATDATVRNLYAIPDADGGTGVVAEVRVPPAGSACDGHDMSVLMVSGNTAVNSPFFVTLN